MNWLLVIAVLVILYLCRGKKKVLVSGVIIGLILCWFMGNNIEGFTASEISGDQDMANSFFDTCCVFDVLKPDAVQECTAELGNAAQPLCASINTRRGSSGSSQEVADFQRARLEREEIRRLCCPVNLQFSSAPLGREVGVSGSYANVQGGGCYDHFTDPNKGGGGISDLFGKISEAGCRA